MSSLVLLVALAILGVFVPSGNSLSKVSVDVYFESLCPDSLYFITSQLHPAWSKISPYVDIHFIPFGKSKSLEDKESFICQHGPNECRGNRIMSCALDGLDNQQSLQVEYVNCFMDVFRRGSSSTEFGKTCADKVALNWKYVTQCYNSEQGTNLQLKAEQETLTVKPSFVPTIVYNKQFDQRDQDESQRNFLGVICKHIQKIQPNAC